MTAKRETRADRLEKISREAFELIKVIELAKVDADGPLVDYYAPIVWVNTRIGRIAQLWEPEKEAAWWPDPTAARINRPRKAEAFDRELGAFETTGQARRDLLAKYAEKPVTPFSQFDGFICEGWDDVIRPDKDGHGLMSTMTEELMSGCADVRVLVKPETPAKDASAMLRKIARWIDHGGMKCATTSIDTDTGELVDDVDGGADLSTFDPPARTKRRRVRTEGNRVLKSAPDLPAGMYWHENKRTGELTPRKRRANGSCPSEHIPY